MERYPILEINIGHIKHNIEIVKKKCEALGVTIWTVAKGATSDMEVVKAMRECNIRTIASSRISQLKRIKNEFTDQETALIRMPMASEIEDVIRYADISAESELETMKLLNEEAKLQNKVHRVLLMQDVGDLREGYFDVDELAATAKYAEQNLKNLKIIGVGTNVGCVGSVMPTIETLNKLVDGAGKVEKAIGRKLEIVSGGATSSLLRIWDKDMPKGINHLRIGEGILNARDLKVNYNYDLSEMYDDCFVLKAQVIEAKRKPSHPIGTLSVDAFGNKPNYIDKGIRQHIIIAMGKADYGTDIKTIIPLEEGIEVTGASSDHTVIDAENAKREIKVGDILSFKLNYVSMLYSTDASDVNKKYIY